MGRRRCSLKFDYPGAAADFFRLAAWVTGLLLLTMQLWSATERSVERSEQDARSMVMREAESLANSYAAQLEQVVEQMDRLTLSLAYRWREAPGQLNLSRERLRGLFPDQNGFVVAIIGPQGEVLRSSQDLPAAQNLSEARFLRLHRDGCCAGMLINPPEQGTLMAGEVIRFSRRIEHADGRFAGAVLVSVASDYLGTFNYGALRVRTDFMNARLDSGPVLATRLGEGVRGDLRQDVYRGMPEYPGEQGVRLMPAEAFGDGLARYVAWRKLDRYPLVAEAGLTEQYALAASRAVHRATRDNTVLASLFLGLLVLIGIIISSRFAARRRDEEDVRRTYRMATDAANEGFYMLTPIFNARGEMGDFWIEDCNERAAALLGLLRAHLIGQRASESMPDDARAELAAFCSKALTAGVCEDELRIPTHGWIRATWIYRRAVHSGSGIALTLRDISDVKAQERALADLANHDALTQLPNRRWLSGFLPSALRRAQRGRGRLALLFIDLDNFKEVNDTLGHEAGDRLLVQAAARIRDTVRASDHVARLGGDEFTVVLEQLESTEVVALLAGEIIDSLSLPYEIAVGSVVGNAATISASVGISLYPDDGTDTETLIKHADVAMYAAKAEGKGCHHFYEPALSDLLLRRLSIAHALRLAIERDEFVVHYQPRVSAITGRLCSIEALLRWQDPERGLLMPAEFISAAEEAGLIVRIGDCAIDKVAAQLAQWRAQGVPLVPVSVNVSPCQLKYASPSASIERALAQHGLSVRLMEVEVTESAMVEHGPSTTRELDALRALGVRLMIDDFGTGYSSLAQLHRLDVDVLKVDQAFTRSLCQGSEGEQLYRAIVSMAAALDMRVVAEGVETLEQLRLLQAIGCDEIQGHIIAQAMPADQLRHLMNDLQLLPFERGDGLPMPAAAP